MTENEMIAAIICGTGLVMLTMILVYATIGALITAGRQE